MKRISTGIHDPIFATTFYLTNGRQAIITIAVDIIYVMADLARIRVQISAGHTREDLEFAINAFAGVAEPL